MSVSFKPHPLSPPRRLLVRGVNWLGDAVMTTPALLRLREALPDTHIALLTRAKLAELWKSHPALDEVIAIERGASVWSVGRRLRGHSFDTALILPNSPRSGLEIWLAGIPRRIGYARPWRNWFLTDVIPTRPGHERMRKRSVAEINQLVGNPCSQTMSVAGGKVDQGQTGRRLVPQAAHQIHEYLHLATALGAAESPCSPLLHVDETEVEGAGRRFEITGGQSWLGLNAGAEYGLAKRWPAERFVAVAKAVQQQTGCGWIIFGGPADASLANEITVQIHNPQSAIRNVGGQTSLRELMALLQQCRVLLTNDTGPMHVAAALGVPVIVPFGSTSSELTGPGLPGDPRHHLIQSEAPCSPCFLRECPIDFRCMHGITVERVVTAVMGVLAKPMNSAHEAEHPGGV